MTVTTRGAPERSFTRLRMVLVLAFLAVACSAQAPVPAQPGPRLYAPTETRTLRSFGAVGDGRRDDTAAVQRALDQSDLHCLDGQGASYRVVGTLSAAKDLCLRNATLRQDLPPFDTTRYIRRRCPATQDAEAVLDCGDAGIPGGVAAALGAAIGVRTLLIRPNDGGTKLRVFLDRVKIDRGRHPEGGSRTDSAGIWLDEAARVDLRNVEITGDGKGFGLLISRSSNITLDNLFVHDLVWSPYRGDTPLKESEVSARGWNAVPIHEFRNWGAQANRPKFYGVRIQEQLVCVGLVNVTHVRIHRTRIQRCMARFASRDLPWQTDGISIGGTSRDIRITDSSVESAWEGIDVVAGGTGIDDLVIDNFSARDSFSFGVKLGYRLRNSRLSRLTVTNSGLAGIVISGSVDKAVVEGAKVDNVGVINVKANPFYPWPAATRAGVRIDEAAHGVPRNILLRDVQVAQRVPGPGYQFGLLNNGGKAVRAERFDAKGFTLELRRNNPTTL